MIDQLMGRIDDYFDVGHYCDSLIAVLERIAVALETANANNPIDAITRALGQAPNGEPEPSLSDAERRVLADYERGTGGLPEDERWRLG